MDDALQKRNTDCVYFLASPLTCKKGIECEYRHGEIARLNPRDCWYWLAGSCLNPTCAFRHPPLDGHSEASSESVPPHQLATSVNRTNVPCYFHFNGFCNKGDKCSFLHGPDDGTPTWKSLKTASAVTDAQPLEKKMLSGSTAGSAPVEMHPNLTETAPKRATDVQMKSGRELCEAASDNDAEQSASPHISASECEEAAAVRSDSLLPAEGFTQNRSIVCTDRSSEEEVDGHIEREEWLESSPGFDVLVDNRSENVGYEEDPEYLQPLDKEGGELNSQYLAYDYEDPVDPNPDVGILYEQERHDSYNQLDDEHTYDCSREVPGHSRDRMSTRILPRKRKYLPMELAFDGQCVTDLREHLNKRRLIDSYSMDLPRRYGSSHLIGRIKAGSMPQGTGRLHGRLTSVVDDNIGSRGENEILLNCANHQSRLRHSRINRSNQHFKEKRLGEQQFISSKVSRKLASMKRSTEESAMFIGPKTLVQIKEKKKAREDGNVFGKIDRSGKTGSDDFQGPKPLSEILKDKRRPCSVVEGSYNSC